MSVAAFGRINIDMLYSGFEKLPEPGEEIYSKDFDIQLGGGSTLIPIVLNQLGVEAKLGVFLSDDMLSEIARKLFTKLGFESYQNFHKTGFGSPVVITTVMNHGHDRGFLSYCEDDRDSICTKEEVYNFLTGSKVCFAYPEYPEVMVKLKEEGTTILYDIGWERVKPVSEYAETLSLVDVFTPNDKEAVAMTDTSCPEDAVKILAKYVKYPIVKVGKEGCITCQNGKIIHIGMPCYFKRVDTTGAGDNFMTGFIYGLDKGWEITECMKMANILGANSVTEVGCFSANMKLTKEKIEAIMRLY